MKNETPLPLKIYFEGQKTIAYNPKLAVLLGGALEAIVLKQLLYWTDVKGGTFYKFTSPCSHEKYVEGDSLEEETGISNKQLSRCLDLLCFRRGKKTNDAIAEEIGKKDADSIRHRREELESQSLFVRYTDQNRVTYYIPNLILLSNLLKVGFLVNPQTSITKKTPIGNLLFYTENTTESTAESTTKNNIVPPNPQGGLCLSPEIPISTENIQEPEETGSETETSRGNEPAEENETSRGGNTHRVPRVEQTKRGGGEAKRTQLQLRAGKLLRYTERRKWDRSEMIAWKSAQPILEETGDRDWAYLEEFYKSDYPYKRTGLSTLLNHWNGEIEKARKWAYENDVIPASLQSESVRKQVDREIQAIRSESYEPEVDLTEGLDKACATEEDEKPGNVGDSSGKEIYL